MDLEEFMAHNWTLDLTVDNDTGEVVATCVELELRTTANTGMDALNALTEKMIEHFEEINADGSIKHVKFPEPAPPVDEPEPQDNDIDLGDHE